MYSISGKNLSVTLADDSNHDSFGRIRVSNPNTQLDINFQYDLQPLVVEPLTANGASIAHTPNYSSATLTTAAQANSRAMLQARQYLSYIPGKSQLVVMTGVHQTAVAGVKTRMGYYDDNDGVFLERNGTTDIAWTVRTSTSGSVSDASRVIQADWNQDTLDGTGSTRNPSGILLDLTKNQILVFDLQWLGAGRVRCGFDIGGNIVWTHYFLHANTIAVPFMKTANLPIRWEIVGNGVANLIATCATVISEGGNSHEFSYQFAYNRAVVTAGNGSQVLAFNIRPKSTFNSLTNRIRIVPTAFSVLVGGANPVLCEIYHNTTVGGAPSWADMNATYSGLQVDTAGTPSGGVKVASFYNPSGASFKTAFEKEWVARYPLTMDIAGTGYTNMTVYVTGYTGTSTCYAGMDWEEVR